MYQFFGKEKADIGMFYPFDEKQTRHARNAARLTGERVRIVVNGQAYFATCKAQGKQYGAMIEEADPAMHELQEEVTLAMAWIRKDNFEWVLEKAAELGVKRIVPFTSRYTSARIPDNTNKLYERWNAILEEAASQCKRNLIPDLCETVRLEDLPLYKTDINLAAYEKAYGSAPYLHTCLDQGKNVLIVIGPEGGFCEEENTWLLQQGFTSVTFGNRILRAETAAVYACAVINEYLGDR